MDVFLSAPVEATRPAGEGAPRPVSELIWRSVQRWPQNLAVESLTYAQLWSRAQQVARRMGPEVSRAAVYTRRNQDAVIGFLACLLHGCRYLPLDIDLPLGRLQLMIKQAEPEAVLASDGMAGLLPWIDNAIGLGPEAKGAELLPPANAGGGYLLFTSGTTGAPRLVTIEGCSLDSYADALLDRFRPVVGDVWIHTASISFSASIRQLILPLISGGRLLVADGECRQIPEMLLDRVQLEGVSVLDTVPSHLRSLTRALERNPSLLSRRLKEVRLTGEGLDWSTVRAWRRVAPEVSLHNLYSSTETGGTVSSYRVDTFPGRGRVPLGQPLKDVTVQLHNEREEVAVEGEIHVSGRRLAGGCHATGDFAERSPEGHLLSLGRKDRMVKLRGHRVDLEEVERALLADPQVEQATVWVDLQQQSLAARVVPAPGETLSLPDLRARLAQSLPSYMVPTRFARLAEIPRTASGKTRLSEPSSARLLEIWRRVLKLPELTEGEDFFEVGGNSLLAVDLVAAVEDELGYRLPPTVVFEASTAASMASQIEELAQGEAGAGGGAYQVQSGLPGTPGLTFVHLGWEHIPDARALARMMGAAYPVFALKALDIAPDSGRPSVEGLASAYLIELRQLQPQGPYRLLGYSFAGLVAYEMAQRLVAAGEQVSMLALLDSHAPRLRRRYRKLRLWDNLRALWTMPSAQRPGFLREKLLHLFPQALARRRRQRNPSSLELMQALRTLYIAAGDRYRPEPYPGDVLLFESEGRGEPEGVLRVPSRGWQKLVKGALRVVRVPGTHADVFRGAALQTVARRLVEELKGPARRFVLPEQLEEGRRAIGVVGLGMPSAVEWASQQNVDRFREAAGDDGLGKGSVPPGFLLIVRYPRVQPWTLEVPSLQLIRHLRMSWQRALILDEQLRGVSVLTSLSELFDPSGAQRIYQTSRTEFTDAEGRRVGTVECETVEVLAEQAWSVRGAPAASPIQPIGQAALAPEQLVAGAQLPPRSWSLGVETLESWAAALGILPEDWGRQAPFDNGFLRAAMLLAMLTSGLPPQALVQDLSLTIVEPLFLGESHLASATIVDVQAGALTVQIRGHGPDGRLLTRGVAKVWIPAKEFMIPY